MKKKFSEIFDGSLYDVALGLLMLCILLWVILWLAPLAFGNPIETQKQKACLESIGPDPAFAIAFIGAISAKKVPLDILEKCESDLDAWRINLSSSEKQEGTLRGILLGHRRTDTASITIKDKTGKYLWGYNVLKINSRKYQSVAEACAKHLKKDFLNKLDGDRR